MSLYIDNINRHVYTVSTRVKALTGIPQDRPGHLESSETIERAILSTQKGGLTDMSALMKLQLK